MSKGSQSIWMIMDSFFSVNSCSLSCFFCCYNYYYYYSPCASWWWWIRMGNRQGSLGSKRLPEYLLVPFKTEWSAHTTFRPGYFLPYWNSCNIVLKRLNNKSLWLIVSLFESLWFKVLGKSKFIPLNDKLRHIKFFKSFFEQKYIQILQCQTRTG